MNKDCPNSKEKGKDGYGLLICDKGYLYDTSGTERDRCNICEDNEWYDKLQGEA